MTNLQQRLITFVIVIPALIGIILFLDFADSLMLNGLVLLFCVGLSYETARVLELFPNPTGSTKYQKTTRNFAVPIIGTLVPALVFLMSRNLLKISDIGLILVSVITLVFIIQVIRTQKNPIEDLLKQTLSYIFLAIYPGTCMAFLIAITMLPASKYVFLMFLFSVFINDTMAYISGRIFGKNSPKPFKISPHKTLIGFIIGFFFSVLSTMTFALIKPEIFPAGFFWSLIIGTVIGITAIIGDLFESGLKRASGLKDSGSAIPGRGGLLDSLDSTIFSVPIFYFIYTISQNIFP